MSIDVTLEHVESALGAEKPHRAKPDDTETDFTVCDFVGVSDFFRIDRKKVSKLLRLSLLNQRAI